MSMNHQHERVEAALANRATLIDDLVDAVEPVAKLIVGTNQLLEEMLAELKHIRAALGQSSRSSVELAENAKGGVQIAVKAYAGSSVDEACVEATAGFATMKREVERGQMEGWKQTVDELARRNGWKT